MKLKRTFSILNTILAVVMIVLSLTLIITISLINNDLNWVTHTYEVINDADELLTNLIDQENSLRGFLATGDEDYIEPYNDSVIEFDENIFNLQIKVDDNYSQVSRLEKINVLAHQWQLEASELYTANKYDDTFDSSHIDSIMDEIRDEIVTFISVEENLLVQRNAKLENQYLISILVIILAIVVVVGITMQQGINTNKVIEPLEDLSEKMKSFDPDHLNGEPELKKSDIYEINELSEGYKKLIHELKINQEELRHLTRTDQLTGIDNRRGFDENLSKEWRRTMRSNQCLTLLMIDIDHFKSFNDTYGHVEGDICLKKVASAISDSVNRAYDSVARFGGEEFVVLLPDTRAEGGALIAEHIRKNIEAMEIENKGVGNDILTVSIGVAETCPRVLNAETSLVENSDTALYKAKKAGRNQTYVFGS